ncbi:MAG: CvpA family protein [Oscillospiraceae bacterium]|nr:CvpA family protein [Oscillospiraceae bacterium]
MNFAIIFDIVLLGIALSVMLSYAHKGFVAGIIELVGNVIAIVGATVISSKASPALFEAFFKNTFTEKVSTTLAENEGIVTLQQIAEKLKTLLPGNILESLNLQQSTAAIDATVPGAAMQIVEDVVQPLFVPILAFVVFFVSFAVIKLCVNFISATMVNINRIPLVGGVNRTLGMVTGFAIGLLYVYIGLCIVWAVLSVTGGIWAFTPENLANSTLYKYFILYNPFS